MLKKRKTCRWGKSYPDHWERELSILFDWLLKNDTNVVFTEKIRNKIKNLSYFELDFFCLHKVCIWSKFTKLVKFLPAKMSMNITWSVEGFGAKVTRVWSLIRMRDNMATQLRRSSKCFRTLWTTMWSFSSMCIGMCLQWDGSRETLLALWTLVGLLT